MFRFALLVAALGSTIALAQRPRDVADPGQLTPTETGTDSARASIDTRSFFPQVQHSVSQRPIRPSNPTRKLTIIEAAGVPSFPPTETIEELPTAGPKFPGITFTGWIPADPDIAVGPNEIVQVVNTEIAFFTKAGVKTFQQNTAVFFNAVKEAAGDQTFDPKVMYDRIANRFVVIILEQTGSPVSNALIGVSDDSNPAGVWHLYRFDTKQAPTGSLCWLDYPGIGYNKDGFVFNGNLFRFAGGSFNGIQFTVLPKAPMLVGGAVAFTRFNDNSGAGSAQAAETMDPVKDTVFAATRIATNLTRVYGFRNLAGVPTLNTLDVGVVNVPSAGNWAASTNGQFLNTIGARLFNGVWRDGHLLLSYNHGVSASITGSHYSRINTMNWPAAGGMVESDQASANNAAINQFLPAVNVNKHGDIAMLFTRSSGAITADIAVSGRVTSDPPGVMSAPLFLAGSPGNNYSQQRWGDYHGVEVDPADDERFWGTAMVVRADNWWDTQIVSWYVSRTWPVAPATAFWFRGAPVGGNAASLANDDGNYMSAKAGLVLFPAEPPAQLQMEATAPAGTVLNIDVTAVAMVNTPGLMQRIELWDWVNGTFVQVGVNQVATMSDSTHTASAGGTLSNFVQAGTGLMRAKVSFYRTGLTLLYPWTASVDQFQWRVRVR
jgi:hypothetical protein